MSPNAARYGRTIAGIVCAIAGLYLLLARGGGDALLDPLMTGLGLYFLGHGAWLAVTASAGAD
jgi:hypothetical protein